MTLQYPVTLKYPLRGIWTWAIFWGLIFGFASPRILQAQDDETLFQDKISVIFATKCLHCHNDQERAGDFSLESPKSLAESGVIEPGDPDSSYLLELVGGSDSAPASMPKNAAPLSAQEQADIRQWIEAGAKWTGDQRLTEPVVDDYQWWSWQPLIKPSIPELPDATWATRVDHPIDRFIYQSLHSQGLRPSPPADRDDLIRRLTYDLTGLPPTPAEIQAFVEDSSPQAYEELVERLLASPRYGERWGRHWLDAARYADTCGYDKDKPRPNAWPYRDYVIRSFNEDKPYRQFVQEQIAGDHLFPGSADGIVGLGFLAAGPWDFIGHVEVPESKLDGKEARNLDRDEMVSATLNVFCSTTVQCARCHNHKFDPITQAHYYDLQAVFAAVDRADRPFADDPTVIAEQHQLEIQLAELKTSLATASQSLPNEQGSPLETLARQFAELRPKLLPTDLQPQYGYHSQIAESVDTPKSVAFEWTAPTTISRVVLYPCYDLFAGIGPGFGFPEKLAIQYADGEALRVAQTIQRPVGFNHTTIAPVTIEFEPPITTSRLVFLAERLAVRNDDFIFALAEIQIFDEQGQSLLNSHPQVSSLDSIEAPDRWSLDNLTDGIWPHYPANADWEALLKYAEQLRDEWTRLSSTEAFVAQQNLVQQIEEQLTEVAAKLSKLRPSKMVYAAATNFEPNGSFQPTRGQPREIRLLHRGNIGQPGEGSHPGTFPMKSGESGRFEIRESTGESARRAALAEWITRADNPLTWRSIVNRVWLHHFGRGLVDSPNDFGRMGQLPTHPQLLDWLASEFRDGPQSLKDLHRLIVTSQTYRQAVVANADAEALDGDSRFYWRMNRRKLTAEEIRDTILSVSGSLDLTMGGPGFYLFELQKEEHSPHYEYHLFDPSDPQTHRRSIYRFVVRSQPDPLMTTLDCADSSQSVGKRDETLTALQALSLLNNPFTLVMAERFAKRLRDEHSHLAEQITGGFRLVTGRDPAPDEHADLVTFAEEHGLENACRLLFNLNEFVFVD